MDRAHTKGRERPILFSAPMVRALLEGRKTQTRRALGQFDVFRRDDGTEAPVSCLHIEGEPLPRVTIGNVVTLKKLKAAVGDRLWVREGFATPALMPVQYRADPPVRHGHWNGEIGPWKSPIHMPHWASRLTLTVTDVRVQRLQEISEEDVRAEGVECDSDGWRDYLMPATQCCATAKTSYLTLWDAINGAGSWAANPWVAAYTFTVERRNIDEGLGQRADATANPESPPSSPEAG